MEKNSKIYIAGHTGMVGSAITRKLLSEGYDNLVFTPFPEYDLTDQTTVAEFFKKEKPDYVFLAAARVGGIMANNTYRAQFIYENLMIQSNVIHHSYLAGVKKLLFLGSSCIYPKESPQPIKEEYLLTGELEYTNEPYAIAKIAGLKMCEAYNMQYGTDFISVMPTNLYGPNDNYDLETSHVLPALIRKMYLGKCLEEDNWDAIVEDLRKRPIGKTDHTATREDLLKTLELHGILRNNRADSKEGHKRVTIKLWGTGNPRREFLHVDDLADACLFLIRNHNAGGSDIDEVDSKQRPSVYYNSHINIGTGKDITIRELAGLITEEIGFRGDLLWDTDKPDGTYRKLLDVSRLKAFGWNSLIFIEEGITAVSKQYRERT